MQQSAHNADLNRACFNPLDAEETMEQHSYKPKSHNKTIPLPPPKNRNPACVRRKKSHTIIHILLNPVFPASLKKYIQEPEKETGTEKPGTLTSSSSVTGNWVMGLMAISCRPVFFLPWEARGGQSWAHTTPSQVGIEVRTRFTFFPLCILLHYFFIFLQTLVFLETILTIADYWKY